MANMKNLASAIEDLRAAAAVITEVADELAQQLPAEPEEAKPQEPAAAIKPALTLEELRPALAAISRAGHTEEVRALLQKYGASKLSEVAPADYEALLSDAQALNDDEDIPF